MIPSMCWLGWLCRHIPNQVVLEYAMDALFMVDLLLEFRTAKFVLKVDAYTTSVRCVHPPSTEGLTRTTALLLKWDVA